jgi:hypothetical protein
MTRARGVLALVLVGCALSLAGCSTHTEGVRWQLRDISTDGQVLTLEAFRRTCGGTPHAQVRETARAVRVRVVQHTRGASCREVARRQRLRVRLRTPLGNRVLEGCLHGRNGATCAPR